MRQEKGQKKTDKYQKKNREIKNSHSKGRVAHHVNDGMTGENTRTTNSRKNSYCPYVKRCGGCQYSDIPYADQLAGKQKEMKKLLGAFGRVEPIIGMENPYHYRHKVNAAFGYEKGNVISGVYEARSHKIVQVDHCLIEHEKADEIMVSIRSLLKDFKIRTYDERTDMGLLKHVMVRVSYATGQIMVILVLRNPILPSKNNFVKALLKLHPEITTIVLNVNDKHTTMVLGKRDIVLFGKGYIEDELCGVTFRLSPQSFYQINPVQTNLLYEKAIEFAHLTGKETVIDAYCGIGTIGLVAAKKVKSVLGIELNSQAVRDARENAKRNEADNVRFIEADAGKYMVQMAEEGAKVDVVFMDPPRSGSDEAFLSSICRLAPKRIVYVSCGPDTLARDLKYLTKHGYQVKKIQPVDMFPMTEHVETIVLLQKRDYTKVLSFQEKADFRHFNSKGIGKETTNKTEITVSVAVQKD